jgi:hypothetical protein
MALLIFRARADKKETTMNMPAKPEDPAKRSASAADRGAPSTYAAYAVRKNVSVRVWVKPAAESDELPEHGYGHGV